MVFVTFGLWSLNQDPCETLKQYDSNGIQIISIVIGEDITASENVQMLTCFGASKQNEMYYFQTLQEAVVQFDSIFTTSIDICDKASPYDGSYYRMTAPDIYGYPVYKLDSSEYDYQISLESKFESEIGYNCCFFEDTKGEDFHSKFETKVYENFFRDCLPQYMRSKNQHDFRYWTKIKTQELVFLGWLDN